MMSDQQPVTANAPFDKANADLILRSSDNVDFHVFKFFLSFASPFFERMLTLPQLEQPEGNDHKDGLPVIPMAESSDVVQKLLNFCYPTCDAEAALETLEDVQAVLEASIKYDMEDIQNRVQKVLVAPRFLEDELGPLRVFAIAFRYRLKDVAILAMRHTRNLPVAGRPYVKELDYITVRAHHQLIDYHWRCSTIATSLDECFNRVCNSDSAWPSEASIFMIPTCNKCSTRNLRYSFGGSFISVGASELWDQYMENAKAALKDRPCGASVLSSDLIDRVSSKRPCRHCYIVAIPKIQRFAEDFAKEIERVTLAVSQHAF
jgi:hypothetical protein